MPDYQSAYRENYSCETALTKIVNDILWRNERQEITALMVIGLSAAFDMVDHQVLMEVLRHKFGIDGVTLEWYKNYLYPCGCQVKVGDSISKVLPFSLPQGSYSGANLYSAYASTLQDVIPKGIDLHGFADDQGYKNSFPAKSEQLESKNPKNVLETSKHGWMRTGII